MKKTHIAALVFIVIAIAAIITTVYDADTYSSFAEARENPGRQFHIIGELNTEKPIEEKIEQNTLTFSFYMFDSDGMESKVLYFGGKPQDFEKLDQIVLVGSYNEDTFVASQLLLKCPSKYRPDEFADTGQVSYE
ncbi:MAG: cytochrome c maturation protein CcmE [Bacteroidetes bacterium]|nr:MAG: cytochrome c maturation protein CcmE [Bacteroidota bacterium]